jgi:hypothetical protein
MAVGDVPLTPIIDTVTGSVTEIGRIFLRTLAAAVNGLAPIDAAYWTSRPAGILTAEVNLGALASGYLKIATAVGIATPTTVPTIPVADVTGLTAALAGKAAVSHHATHEPGGADALVGAAWLAQANVFTADQRINKAAPVLYFNDPTAPVDARLFRIVNTTQLLYLQAVNDAVSASQGLVSVDRTGKLAASGAISAPSVQVSTATVLGGSRVMIAGPGTTSSGIGIQNTDAGNSEAFLLCYNSAGAIAGYISQTGASTVAYITSSDARLKTDRGRATDLAALRALVIHDFEWTADGIPDRGIFAQEAHALYPRAVVPGTDDRTEGGDLARPWGTDYSKFVPDLIAGWQAHEAELAALRARLDARPDR